MRVLNYPEQAARVARHLAGRPVILRDRAPYLKGVLGMLYNHQGRAVIDISPELEELSSLRMFLHEVSHLKRDFPTLPESSYALLEPASVSPVRGALERLAQDASEEPAERLARSWFQYAEKRAGVSASLKARLEALERWLPPEWQEIIDNVVRTAIREYRSK